MQRKSKDQVENLTQLNVKKSGKLSEELGRMEVTHGTGHDPHCTLRDDEMKLWQRLSIFSAIQELYLIFCFN